LSRKVDRGRAGRREAAVQPWRREDDPLGAGVVVIAPEHESERHPRTGDDRAWVVAVLNGYVDDLVAVSVDGRSDGLLEHGYP
jgi:hypothetical protein